MLSPEPVLPPPDLCWEEGTSYAMKDSCYGPPRELEVAVGYDERVNIVPDHLLLLGCDFL